MIIIITQNFKNGEKVEGEFTMWESLPGESPVIQTIINKKEFDRITETVKFWNLQPNLWFAR